MLQDCLHFANDALKDEKSVNNIVDQCSKTEVEHSVVNSNYAHNVTDLNNLTSNKKISLVIKLNKKSTIEKSDLLNALEYVEYIKYNLFDAK